MTRILAERLARLQNQAQRGATLVMLGLTLVTVLSAGAIAVDLAAVTTRGQSLQNSVDAASLAGVVEWATSGDQARTRAVVQDLLVQNGEDGADITFDIEFPTSDQIEVTIVDSDLDVILGEFVGFADEVNRQASARFRGCDFVCDATYQVPEPPKPISYNGSGDGYRPIVVDGKVYAPRHHNNLIGCVDRATNDKCWASDRQIFQSGTYSLNTTHPYLLGSKIYVLGFNNGRGTSEYANTGTFNQGELHLTCWETLTDVPCASSVQIPNERHGILVGYQDKLIVLTAHSRAYCYDAATFTSCGGSWTGGIPTESSSMGWDERFTSMRNSTFRETDGNIYFTIGDDKQTRGGQHHLECFSVTSAAPCSGFGVHAVNSDSKDAKGDIAIEGRLFFGRDAYTGTPNSICSTGKGTGNNSYGADRLDCFTLWGSPTSISGSFESFVNGWEAMGVATGSNGAWTASAGQHTYHEQSNRTFFLGQHTDHKTYCWDWDSGYCGEVLHSSAPSPYGYWPTTECLFGLGHNKKFFTIKPDLTEGCDSGNLLIPIDPCSCGEETEWPTVTANNLELVDRFRVRLLDSEGVQFWPEVENTWHDFTEELAVVADDDEVNLSGIASLDLEELLAERTESVQMEVLVNGEAGKDPWADGQFPEISLESPSFRPHLALPTAD